MKNVLKAGALLGATGLLLVAVLAVAQTGPRRGTTTAAAPCGVTTPCAAISYNSTITDGGAGFVASGFGQILQGPGACTGLSIDPNTGYNHFGTLTCPGVWDLGDTIRLQQGQISIAGQLNLYGSAGRLLMARTTILQCGVEVSEGTTMVDAASGGTTAHRTRDCFCTSDGGATPAYAWQNKISGTVGTSTTCPD